MDDSPVGWPEGLADRVTEAFEEGLRERSSRHFALRLYVAGVNPSSQRAVANLTSICEELLAGRYTLEVIDLYQQPDRAIEEDIVVAPTLVRVRPEPVTRLVGDLSDRPLVVRELDIGA
ncbi:MAG TPA: circadian clock KaiB family protein [Acidimicrobiales bacterium]|nr:circadian clock KaiB family protein [Acidimicrobiales bacterium]